MILAHAKDAYLYGYLDFTDQICKDYSEYLDLYASVSNEWERLPWRWQREFNQMKGEMVNIRHRIASHLDYFGNPAGWVPMLSFEVNKAMFEHRDRSSHSNVVLDLLDRQCGDQYREPIGRR